jgi:methylated-DNA-protein-cysteine methyltransferase-like protein
MNEYTRTVIEIIKRIPEGKVCTYGGIGRMAGKASGARQVAWILHRSSRRHQLPWHRVINARGTISLPKSGGYAEQKARLQAEGIGFDAADRVNLEKYLWNGEHANLEAPR